MKEIFGTSAENCLIGIGPSIGACCYEVDANVVETCEKVFPNNFDELIIKRDGKIFLDLWAANKIQLMEVGLPEKNIDVAAECTRCNSNWYFSYRAARQNNLHETGRIAALIALKDV